MVFRNILFTIVIALTLVACGGGGGGGSSISYTGSRDPAVIDTTNAKTLAEEAVGGSQTGVVLAVESDNQESQPNLTIIGVSKILSSSVRNIEMNDSVVVLVGAIITESGTDPCLNGGTLSFNLSLNDVTGEISGTFNFTNCTEGGTTISGSMTVSGTINLSTLEFTQFTFSMNSVTVVSGSESITMSGTIDFSFSGSSFTMTMDVFFRDNASGSVVWFENLSISATDNISNLSMSISGRFYHPDHGFIEIVTNQAFLINNSDLFPNSGQMTITGANGSSARLTVIDNTQYTLEVDEDGDGTYETVTMENWG